MSIIQKSNIFGNFGRSADTGAFEIFGHFGRTFGTFGHFSRFCWIYRKYSDFGYVWFTYPKGVHSYRFFLQPKRTPNALPPVHAYAIFAYGTIYNRGICICVWVYGVWVGKLVIVSTELKILSQGNSPIGWNKVWVFGERKLLYKFGTVQAIKLELIDATV